MQKHYDPKKSEKKWQKFWRDKKLFKFNPKSRKPVYSIDTPPPYANADHLHMGHAMHYSQFEFVARFQRMLGKNVFFPLGFDDNGLPTERYVEKKYNITKSPNNRKKFLKLCQKETSRLEEEQMKPTFNALGFSCDWSLSYRTIDEHSQKIAQMSFLDLYNKGLVYRAKEPNIWCPYHQTALAQAEVEDMDRSTKLNYIKFELEDGKKIEIATTRPEFLPACVGIFVNPKDKRHKALVGKKAVVPLFGQKVKIMKDKAVDKDFGTGIVMICTFGDKTDIDWWRKHKLDLRICLTEDGKMNDKCGKYKGQSIEQARKSIIKDLKKEGLLKKQEPLQQTVGVCWRCDTPVEFLVAKQWFVKALPYKKQLIKQGRKINWHPDFYRKRYEDWVKNLGWDWCISRQRYYGIPIPVWYCECGEIEVADEKEIPIDPRMEKKKCKKCGKEMKPEEDVLDTWMTSSMSPEIATEWLEDDKKFKRLFPMTMRPQAHDIIRTWTFYTILKAYHHFKKIPWKDVMMSGHGLDPKGKPMSKSRGNVVIPEDVIEKYSADAIRYWAASVKLGDDLCYREKDVKNAQKFLTKLWNASRFATIHLKKNKPRKVKLTTMDKWLLTKLSKVIKYSTENFKSYSYSKSKDASEQFFWQDFCDNYLEFIKYRMYEDKKKSAAQWTLYHALLDVLKLFAPIVPHITEGIYQEYYKKHENDKSIHISDWPEAYRKSKTAEKAGDMAVDIVAAVRQHKNKEGVSLNQEFPLLTIEASSKNKKLLKKVLEDIKGTTKAKEIKFGKPKKRIKAGPVKIGIEM